MKTDESGARPSPRRQPSLGAIVGVVLAALVIYGISRGNGPSVQQQTAERNVIGACWRDAALPGATPAKTAECERMESGFRQKYGDTP